MYREHSANSVLVQIKTESQIDLLSNARAAVSWVALFHRNDGIDDFLGGSLGSGLTPSSW